MSKQSKGKNLGTSSLIILIVVGVIILGVIGYIIWQFTQKETPGPDTIQLTVSSEIAQFSSSLSSDPVSKQEESSAIVPSVSSSASDSTPAPAISSASASTPAPAISSAPVSTPAPAAFEIPDFLLMLFQQSKQELVGDRLPDGYLNGANYYKSDQFPGLRLFISDGGFLSAIDGNIDTLIPGEKSSYTYQELKEIFGDRLEPFEYWESSGTYGTVVEIEGYTIIFDSGVNSPNAELDTFQLKKL